MTLNAMRPIHPGEILREEYLKPLAMSAHALSKALHVPASRINDIALGRRGVTPDTALRLVRYFGGDARSWLNLQQAYDLKMAEKVFLESMRQEIVPLNPRHNDEHFALAA